MTEEEQIQYANLQRRNSDLEKLVVDLRAALAKANAGGEEDEGPSFSYESPDRLLSEPEVYEYIERRIANEAARFSLTGGGDVQVSGSGFNWAVTIKDPQTKQ